MAGPMPPPNNGMSLAFGFAVSGLLERGWNVRVLDLADRSTRGREQFTFARLAGVLRVLVESLRVLPGARVFYLTISQSRLGLAKDCLLLLLAHALRVRTTVHLHGGALADMLARAPGALRWWYLRVLRRVDRFIVLSERLRGQFALADPEGTRTVVLPNPSLVPFGKPRASLRRPPTLLYLSTMQPEKGYLDLLAALELLAARGVPCAAHFAGKFALGSDGVSPESAERAFRERLARLADPVTGSYHGEVTGKDKVRLFDLADFFVFPTRLVEGQPIAVIEALSSGLPVLVPATDALLSLLPEHLHAFAFVPEDPRSLADAVEGLCARPERYADLTRASLACAQPFRPDLHLDALAAVLALWLSPLDDGGRSQHPP